MTVVLFAAGGLLAGLGTRLSAVALVAAAVFGARQPQPVLAALCTWTAATAAGWILLDRRSPRALAVPCLGASAVLAAAGAPNGAVVLGLWGLGTISAVVSVGTLPSARRWALGLAVGDVVFAVAIATTAGRGFEGWPATLKAPGALAMLAAAVLRAPLAGGPIGDRRPDGGGDAAYPALLIVRAQTIMLVGLAIAAGGRAPLRPILVLGAVAFAVATVASARSTADTVQELGLVAMAIAGAALGWVPAGWAWGALAAGTLIHHLRLTVESRAGGGVADAIVRGGGVGLPFLPVAAALLEGAFSASSRLATVVLVGVLLGFAGRASMRSVSERSASAPVDHLRAWGPIALAAAASVAAPLLWLPQPPGGGDAPWPGVWAAAIVAVAAIVGSQLRDVVTMPTVDVRTPRHVDVVRRAATDRMAALDVIATDVVLWATFTAVGAAGVVLWLIGLGRGFL
jgi:hypothetical protein